MTSATSTPSAHRSHPRPPAALPVLLVTDDERLLDDVLRLAAAAGVTLEVAHDAGTALRSWSAAAMVLVGSDLVEDLAVRRPSRHDDVHVVGVGTVPDRAFRAALGVGARDVVELPAGESWLVELLGDVVDGGRAQGGVLGVMPGSGGAGASTFAAAVAQVAARSAPTMLLDLDPWGPGLGRTLGFDDVDGIRWDALSAASGRLGSRSLRAALPTRDRLSLLTYGAGPPPVVDEASVREVVAAAQRAGDLVLLDLPRTATGSAGGIMAGVDPAGAALGRCERLLLVVLGTVSGVAAAARVATRLVTERAQVGVVVRTVTGAVAAEAVADALGLPLAADYPSRRRVVEQVDLGLGPVRSTRSPLARAARDALAWAARGGS
jgi:secretion/DNA translocation related CpaE-like protein